MNTYYVTDESFANSNIYQEYLKENPGTGNLRVRTYAARGAIPISGVRIVVTKIIDNNEIVFYEGVTDASGIIEKIKLPTPRISDDDTIVPLKATYKLTVTYEKENMLKQYDINMYDGICVVQNINIPYNNGESYGN